MGTANSLEDLRRRMAQGAAPGAFAVQAEEHRRAGRLDEAVAVCRDGLERYPTYVSARVTLGRALLDLGEVEQAIAELTAAVRQAPDNLAAARALELARAQAPTPDVPAPDAPVDAAHPALETPPGGGAAFAWLVPVEDEGAAPTFASEDTATHAVEAVDLSLVIAAPAHEAWEDQPIHVARPVGEVESVEPTPLLEPDWPAPSQTVEGGDATVASAGTWSTSLDEAVAEVFAHAGGDVSSEPPSPAPGGLDDLQSLLAAIRARRAALAEPHSGVD